VRTPLVMLTCYDATFAKIIADTEAVDFVLVGDSAANVIYGDRSTTAIGLDRMMAHVVAVRKGLDQSKASQKPALVADLPAGFYETPDQAVSSALKLRAAGASWVKPEGPKLSEIRAIREKGVSVCGHLGFTPQTILDPKVQGRDESSASRILQEARDLESAGCEMIVLELVPRRLAKKITESLQVPTIGIGAGPECTGQVLVLYDLLGLNPDFKPKFLKKYLSGAEVVSQAIQNYAKEVRTKEFPSAEHSFE
jgi:3-methyl-2-oxobutanoate hydroxymethyltransferase